MISGGSVKNLLGDRASLPDLRKILKRLLRKTKRYLPEIDPGAANLLISNLPPSLKPGQLAAYLRQIEAQGDFPSAVEAQGFIDYIDMLFSGAALSASPQAENGHIDVANEIAEQFAKVHLTGNQWKVLWVVLRQTWGWHRKESAVSISRFQQLTGLDRRHTKRTLDELLARNLITKNGNSFIASYGFQKDYTKWRTVAKIGNKRQTVAKIGNATVAKIGTHKRKEKKKDIKSSSSKLDPIPYKEILEYLNRTTKKSFSPNTESYQRLIKARWREGKRLSDFNRVVDIKCTKWKDDPKMCAYLRPETLFGTKMDSYLNEGSPEPVNPYQKLS
jgi:phage replication O-like protein O